MPVTKWALGATAAATMAAGSAEAGTLWVANLSGAGENPPTNATFTGTGFLVLNDAETQASVTWTHTIPANPDDQATVAAMMGLPDAAALLAELEAHRQFVAEQFDAIFADKGGNSEQVDPATSNECADPDNREAIEARFASLGYNDPAAAAQRLIATWQSPKLSAMPETSRNRLVALVNAALPQIARAAEQNRAGTPLATLGRLLDFLEAVARRSAYLSLLTEYPHTLERVIRMMHASGWAATFLNQHPILLDELLDDRLLNTVFDPAAVAIDLQRQL